ncbi:conserved domain protein [Streptococcus constellatus subsp. pharyngis SK1060 = CCUG 46377]|uniref:Conserved domain protein n=1 Tax=Streptococcus constellatus subsp. pharyngis SK1060 = CCUG 46377 TaxID=1035184 RepID=F9P9Y9_STRCV|nr:conserved domain protein [Streptococcus constellatus subsp. pharyngis SK1060 = CCUG 46377]
MDKFFTDEHGYFNWQSVLAIVGILGFLWGFISMLINENRRYKNEKYKVKYKNKKN